MLERDIEARVVKYVESLGGEALKLRIDGKNGFPDRTVILPNGKVFFVEFKTPDGSLRSAQTKAIRRLTKLRQEVHVVRSVQAGLDLVDKILGI